MAAILPAFGSRPSRIAQLEEVQEELESSYWCIEKASYYKALENQCNIELTASSSYIEKHGDFEIMQNTYNDGVLEGVIKTLQDCVLKPLSIKSIEDIPPCGTMTTYDIYYELRFAHWLMIPYLNAQGGKVLDVRKLDIENDITPYLLPGNLGSRLGIIRGGKPIPFIDRLD
jgi:hypothetical protein